MKKSAICPGSFDPLTNGHLNIIKRGLTIFDRIVVAVAINSNKTPLFSLKERLQMLREFFADEPRVEIDSFEGLLVDYARDKKIRTILRGIRTMSDYDYEFQMALANRAIYKDLETVFMMTDIQFSHLSSTIIKDVARYSDATAQMVPELVQKHLVKKYNPKKRGNND